MLRVQAVVLVIVLVAAPFEALARSLACDMNTCECPCCKPRAMNSSSTHSTSQKAQTVGMPCHHRLSNRGPGCTMTCGHNGANDWAAASFPPTILTAPARLASPEMTRQAVAVSEFSLLQGLHAVPFTPPRL